MKKQNSIYFALVFILIASQACSGGGTAPESSGVTPTAIPEAGETTPTVIPGPLPSGYMELLDNKIASGEWTEEEGLVTLLKMFIGEIQVSEADLGQGVPHHPVVVAGLVVGRGTGVGNCEDRDLNRNERPAFVNS